MVIHRTGRLSTPRPMRLRRSGFARGLLSLSLIVLCAAAARLQVLDAEEWAQVAKNNRLRKIMVPAPRGTIYDRHGQVIAENQVGYRVLLMPGDRTKKAAGDSMNAQLERLKLVLGMTEDDLKRARRRWSRETHLPMTVLADANPEQIARIEEQRGLFPGVLVYEYAKRHYPAGRAVAHLIGYVAEINEKELEDTVRWGGYEQGQWIGKSGLERFYEKEIGCEPGSRYLEIDAQGKIKRWLPEQMGLPPIPGRDLQLNIDLDLQRYIMGIWPRQFRGAFVAIDPTDGGVLAYVSYPSFDPNDFIGGVSDSIYQGLRNDPATPLLDRVSGTGAAQPPASTWKLAVAAMALEEKVVTPEQYMPVSCSGGMQILGRYAKCWESAGHGRVNMINGIWQSCDVYFYQLGQRIGFKRYLELGTRMGFAKRTGIDLPSEQRNSFPESPDYWVRNFRYQPKESEVVSLSIGQGATTMTPLKMAVIYTAMARPDGKTPEPRIARIDNDTTRGTAVDLGLTNNDMDALWRGMRRVVVPPGTAGLTRLKDWDLMGKTGTAQACALGCGIPDHAWFVGMAGPKGKSPEIVAAMFLQNAEHGYTASDYLANAMDFYLDRKYGNPYERYATARTKALKGLPFQYAYEPIVDYLPFGGGVRPDSTKKPAPR